MHSASSTKDTRLRVGVIIDALPEETETISDKEDKKIFNQSVNYFSLTLNPNLPDWAISSFVTATNHQLIVSNLRHGEVHEVPASDIDFPVDVACLSEHDLESKKHGRLSTFLFWGAGDYILLG